MSSSRSGSWTVPFYKHKNWCIIKLLFLGLPDADLLVLIGQMVSTPSIVVVGSNLTGSAAIIILSASGRSQVPEVAVILGNLEQHLLLQ